MITLSSPSSQKKTVFLCNGLEVSKSEADENGKSISLALKGVEVEVLHNPTSMSSYFNRMQGDKEAMEAFSSLCSNFFNQIKKSLINKFSKAIIICHSDGATIIEKTMKIFEKRSFSLISQITIFSFGGATILNKNLAYRVENYTFEHDFIALVGKTFSSSFSNDNIHNIHNIHRLPNPHKTHHHGMLGLIKNIGNSLKCHEFKSYEPHIIKIMKENLNPVDSKPEQGQLNFKEVPLTDMRDFKVIFKEQYSKFKDLNHKRKAEGCDYERAKRQLVYLWNHKPESRHFILNDLICSSIQSSIEIDSTGKFLRLRKNSMDYKVYSILKN